jgi:hypothetical protein
VAWQLGPNINAVERGDLREALRYARLAQSLAGNATPTERALIDAMVVRYADEGNAPGAGFPQSAMCGSGGTSKAHPLDIAYALRLRVIADTYPDDPDVVSLYAEAEMVATRDDWWDQKTGQPAGRIGEVADRLERALSTHVDHIGVNHYLIHAVDAPGVARRAVAAADRLGSLAPQSPHLVHMPSHTYVRVARYADATRVNQSALDAQQRLDARLETLGFTQTKNWNGHNRHFLWFATLMQGRGDLALETARRIAGAATSKSPWGGYQRGLPLLTLVRLARWGDALEETAGAGEWRRCSPRFRVSSRPRSRLRAATSTQRWRPSAKRSGLRRRWAANRQCSLPAARSRSAICSCAPDVTRRPRPHFAPTWHSSPAAVGRYAASTLPSRRKTAPPRRSRCKPNGRVLGKMPIQRSGRRHAPEPRQPSGRSWVERNRSSECDSTLIDVD